MLLLKTESIVGCYLFILAISTSLKGTGFGTLPDELPENERFAVLELEEGLFDSVSWELLEPFYTEPLSVPLGELRYLRDIFPDLPEDIPVSPEVLARYEPWTDENIVRFLNDYPYLIQLRHLLSFEIKKMPTIAHIGFFSNVSGLSNRYRQSIRFTANPVKYIRADGTINFEKNFARWQRRRILFDVPYIGRTQIGNLSFTMNRGLFYGYFPGTSVSYDTVKHNWLYGNSRTWNGFSSETSIGKIGTIRTLIHSRISESIAGLKAELYPGSFLSFYGAFSGAIIESDSTTHDTLYALHGGVASSIGQFAINLESGADLKNIESIPIYIKLSHGKSSSKHTVSFIRIPGGFYAPRSSLLHSFYNRLETDDSTSSEITGVDISFSAYILKYLKQTLNVSYLSMENSADLKTSYRFYISKPFDCSIYYSLNASDYHNNLKHRIKISWDYIASSVFGISSAFSYYIKPEAYHRIMINLQTDFKLFSSMTISPFGTFISGSKTKNDFALGIKQKMDFFEKTYGEIILTVPVISHYNEIYSFYAKSYFLF